MIDLIYENVYPKTASINFILATPVPVADFNKDNHLFTQSGLVKYITLEIVKGKEQSLWVAFSCGSSFYKKGVYYGNNLIELPQRDRAVLFTGTLDRTVQQMLGDNGFSILNNFNWAKKIKQVGKKQYLFGQNDLYQVYTHKDQKTRHIVVARGENKKTCCFTSDEKGFIGCSDTQFNANQLTWTEVPGVKNIDTIHSLNILGIFNINKS